MSIDTTLYIHATTLGLINDACAVCGAKRNRIIVMLLMRTMTDTRKMVKTGSTIRYQNRDCKEKWHTVHVRFREDEADYFKDLRNFIKQSDSLILAQAARDYLNEIVRRAKRTTGSDNYPFSNYILSREEVNGLIFWKICWGFPINPENHFTVPSCNSQ